MPRRDLSDERYVLDLVSSLLAEPYTWQHKFPGLEGDPGRDGKCRLLPVDAYFPRSGIVVEYDERQHSTSVLLWDQKPTVSGVSRGVQRALYATRKRQWVVDHGLRLLLISYSDLDHKRGRLTRNAAVDRESISHMILTRIQAGKEGCQDG